MGQLKLPPRVKLFIGLLAREETLLAWTEKLLVKRFGPVDLRSPVWPFTQTDYYREEMGPELKRRFLSFIRLIKADDLARIKNWTKRLEKRLSDRPGRRKINLDPGYLDLAKVVLASTKDFSHRLYLSRGIFAEITLGYQKQAWRDQPWTYPDYRTNEYKGFLEEVRNAYQKQLAG